MGLDERREISEDEAVVHWYDNVYVPIVTVVRERDVLRDFPGRTEADVYIWVLDRQHLLFDQGRGLAPPDAAVEQYVSQLTHSLEF